MTPWQILGIPPGSSKETIRDAYRKLARQWHPDKNPSPQAQQKFIEITEAYDYLMSGKQASLFDFGKTFFQKKNPPKSQKDIRQEFHEQRKRQQQLIEKMRYERYLLKRNLILSSRELNRWKRYYFGITLADAFFAFLLFTGPLILLFLTSNKFFLASYLISFPAALYMRFCTELRYKHYVMLFGNRTDYTADDVEEFFIFEKTTSLWKKAQAPPRAERPKHAKSG